MKTVEKIYLDTSIISYLQQEDPPEKTEITIRFWNKLKKMKNVKVYLSEIAMAELNKCHEPKLSFMKRKITEINFTLLEKNAEVETLSQKIINLGILPEKSHDDCYHIALAVLNECNYML